MADLENVIEDSLADATLPEEPQEAPEPVEDSTPTEPVETAPEPSEAPTEPISDKVKVKDDVPDTKEAPKPVEDEFSKKYGIPAQALGGKENRIPYSRVKKITEKAATEAAQAKVKEYEPKIQEYETKLKDYEGRLSRVDQFEKVMVNNPDQFLQMLAQLPAYQQFFQAVETAFSKYEDAPTTEQPTRPQHSSDDMPVPDQKLPDGTMVYSMDGLKSLLAWQAAQVENRVTKQVEERYKPIESEWQAHQRVQAVVPVVQAQIADARTWPLFNENEESIVQVLKDNPKISLEGAYRQVVFPKMVADRNKIREEVLEEVKKAPRATSAPTAPARSSAQASPSGPRSLEDIIAEQIKGLK